METASIDDLKQEWTDQHVQADASVPELARFKGMTGRVVTINENGRALVDFKDGPWYDVPLDHLIIVPAPEK